MEVCKPKVGCRSYVIPRTIGFGLYLICCLLRYRAGCHLASCMFVVKRSTVFRPYSSVFHYVFQLVTVSGPFCSLDVTLSKSVFCVHTATLSVRRLICGTPTADARLSMWKRSGNRTYPCWTSCFKVTVWLLTPSNVTQVSQLDCHA